MQIEIKKLGEKTINNIDAVRKVAGLGIAETKHRLESGKWTFEIRDVALDWAYMVLSDAGIAFDVMKTDALSSEAIEANLKQRIDELETAIKRIDQVQYEGYSAGDDWKAIRQIIGEVLPENEDDAIAHLLRNGSLPRGEDGDKRACGLLE